MPPKNAPFKSGRHFRQIPGPSNVPDRIRRAMDMPTMDHRSAAFAELGHEVLRGCQAVFQVDAVLLPEEYDADNLRQVISDHYDMSLGTGLGKLKGRVLRIGHLGDFNDLMLAGTLAGMEMGLHVAGVPHGRGGMAAAMDYLAGRTAAAEQQAA